MEGVMKLNKIVFVCLIGLFLACGLVFFGCSGCDNGGDCWYRYDGGGVSRQSLCSSSGCASVVAYNGGSGLPAGCGCN